MYAKRGKSRQGGLVILESLVAILIFSIGILALVGMQASAINNVSDAKYRSTAGFLADSIVETIRSSSPTILLGGGQSGVALVMPDPTFCTSCLGVTPNATAQAWVSGVMEALPNASGPNAPGIVISGAMVTVTVNWQPPRAPTVHRHTVAAFIN